VASSAKSLSHRPVRVALVAGEESGDILASGLMRELKRELPDVQFEGVGGTRMQLEGLNSIFPMERLSVMGLVEVLKRLPELLNRRRNLATQWLIDPPDIFIGVDAPDFNLGLEKQLKTNLIPTVHYVSPSVWAWRASRLKKIEAAVDTLLCFLPFEASFYRDTRVDARFIGHPLADILPPKLDQQTACVELGLDPTKPVVCLMPGSRGSEVDKLSADFLDTALWLKQRRADIQFVIPAANAARHLQLTKALASRGPELKVRLLLGQSQVAMVASNAVLIASGTATLEAMLCRCPMVVTYRMASLSYALISRLLKTRYISLPNLLADEALVPEVLQDQVTPDILGPLVLRTLDDRAYRAFLLERFDQLAHSIRLGANKQAARAVIDLLRSRGKLSDVLPEKY